MEAKRYVAELPSSQRFRDALNGGFRRVDPDDAFRC
jgi:hypothetical protein